METTPAEHIVEEPTAEDRRQIPGFLWLTGDTKEHRSILVNIAQIATIENRWDEKAEIWIVGAPVPFTVKDEFIDVVEAIDVRPVCDRCAREAREG